MATHHNVSDHQPRRIPSPKPKVFRSLKCLQPFWPQGHPSLTSAAATSLPSQPPVFTTPSLQKTISLLPRDLSRRDDEIKTDFLCVYP
ncbi:hypothetical protein Zmor_004384 [Zophobas morio]|uniref:Uncharacterized protein n=1 Tax=Zophobas morio TaxID=2755281 RepID=A0AA38HJX3_9CUCU|nr:hypothetical protein Zmor_004384 [Zophobas morio]